MKKIDKLINELDPDILKCPKCGSYKKITYTKEPEYCEKCISEMLQKLKKKI